MSEHNGRTVNRRRIYLTTAIPYVNGAPHIGHALELVQVDALARAWRARGHEVRTLTGTDDNALKNVRAAEAAGVPVADFVRAHGDEFVDLFGPLSVELDDVIRTSSDPRHRPGVERLWRACAERGDLYEKEYEGTYCVGCEAFLDADELDSNGRCPEHRAPPDIVRERNWFFRLSRYGDRIATAIASGALRIEPASRRNEVLAQLRSGLRDISVSRSIERAHGWGIPVPDDPSQVVYVWFDALGELPHRPRAWGRRGTLVARGGRTDPSHRQGHHPLPRPLLAGDPGGGRPAASDCAVRTRLPDGRRHQDLEDQQQRSGPGRASSTDSVPMPSAGGCSANLHSVSTPTSPSTGSSGGPTTIWPTGSATS